MDFSWSEEQEQLRSAIAAFAKKQLNDGLRERDDRHEFNLDGFRSCAQMGVQGLNIPSVYGGLEQDPLTTAAVLESLGYGCRDNGLCFSIGAHMWTAQVPLLNFGTDEQKRRFLPRLVSGELIGGNAMSEPGSGSDAYSLKTTATRKPDAYVLNGNKAWVTNGPVADLLVVYATVDPEMGKNGVTAFIVEKERSGFSVTRTVDKMGLNTSPMGELLFEDCEVPAENRLGAEGAGQALFNDSMTWERGYILASAVGAMERLLERTVEYATIRKQFGESIRNFQLVGSKLVDMRMRLECARALLYRAAWRRARGKNVFVDAALAKIAISEGWVQIAQDALQIHGANGYSKEYEIERELRDALGSKIYSGTSEIQRVIAASLMH